VVPIAHGSLVVTRRVQLKRARFRDNGFIEGKKRFQLCFVASHSAVEVGFLGTGRMGKVMAANLLKAGHRARAWDKSSEPLHELKRAGAEWCSW
jgi:lactate dehydrogenase-like 2-hydroxyacid dehydrogenase